MRTIFFLLLSALIFVKVQIGTAQETSSDELFQRARQATFERKDYAAAINLCKKALLNNPENTDISLFLGRLYTWTDHVDSARRVFIDILEANPGNEEASLAYGNLEFWNKNLEKALLIINNGLSRTPESTQLLLLKVKVLNEQNKLTEANQIVTEVLKKDPKNTEARSLSSRINESSFANSVGMDYDFTYFDKQFNSPWQLASVNYGRQTKIGIMTARVNYANRFNESGLQMELEVYPRISKTFYAYIGGGYSADEGIFPKYRTGFSLYANLPAAFEAEAGFRLLHFTSNTSVYTFAAGKYIKNYWLNFRTYLTPSDQNISQAYSFTARYYYGSADDYFSIALGRGISPDNNENNILLNNKYKLNSNNISIGYRHLIKGKNVIKFGASYLNQEYNEGIWGNQINVSAGYQRRF